MSLTKEDLQEVFDSAKQNDFPYVFVRIVADGVEELIVIPEKSFEAKKKFYASAYDDNLKHVMNKSVSIVGLSFGDGTNLRNTI